MNGQQKKLNQVVFFNMLGPVLLNGINFFVLPILTRLLGADNYGVYTVYTSYQSFLVIFMGLQTSGIIGTISVYYSHRERDRCLSNSLTISLCSCILFSLLIGLLIRPIAALTGLSVPMWSIMLLHTVGMVGTQWATSLFGYDKKAKTNFLISISVALSSIALSFLFLLVLMKEQEPYEAYAWGHMIPYALAGALFFVYFLRRGKSFFSKPEWAFCLPLCLPLVFHSLSNTVLHQCDKIMVQNFLNDAAAGVYGFAVMFANIISIIFHALNTAWVPFYHDDVLQNQRDRLRKKTNNYVFLFTCLTVGFIMAMPEVVKVFGDEEFWPSIKVIPILVLGMYFVFLYSFPVNFEFFYKKTKNIAVGTTLACLGNVAMNWFFIQRWGLLGAALATLAAYVLLYLFHLLMARVFIKEEYHYPFKCFYVYTAIVVGMTALFYVIEGLPLIRWGIFLLAAVLLLLRVYKNRSIF